MQCLAPVTLWRPRNIEVGTEARTDVVSCGKCPACLARRRTGWVFRLKEEQRNASSSAFLTLTYDDENLPWSENGYPTLLTKDHQDFMKRIRSTIKNHFSDDTTKPLKYYAVGEYGTKTHRPHYHSILFNLPDEYFKHPELLDRDWQKGQTLLAECNIKTIKYVTGYINKTIWIDGQIDGDDRLKERSYISKGIGKDYLTPSRIKYYQNILTPYLIIENGDKTTMPRYYKEKMYNQVHKNMINEKTMKYLEENPQFLNEKHRVDYIENAFNKHNKNNKQKRLTL